jgi:hypothetical protein
MASWTDRNAPNFSPYIQQLPVEAMVNVGTQKQQLYNEGLQRIQSQIDSVAGMDVVRDVDKSYLQSKLDQLGSNLKSVAAADFSDFQLTNSIGGAINKIAKDNNVVNAVSSARMYRQQTELLRKDITEGKSNPANELAFNKAASKWLNSNNIEDVFSATYIPPRDVWGKIKDIATAVGVSEQDIQQMYQTDEQGNVIYDENGNAKWNPIMVQQALKGKDPSVLLKAFQAALTPEDYRQLAIEGEYAYSSYSPEQLKMILADQSKTQIDSVNYSINQLNAELVLENSKNEKDENKIKSLSEQLTYFQNFSQKLKNSIEKGISAVDSNPDVVRGSLYTNNYLNEMSQVLSSQSVSTKYSVSPLFEITMRQNEFNRLLEKDKVDNYYKSQELGLKYRAQELDEKKFLMELEESQKTGGSENFVREPIDLKDVAKVKQVVESEFQSMVGQLNQKNREITLSFFREVFNDKDSQEVSRIIEDNAKAEGLSLDDYSAKIVGDLVQKYKTNPSNVPPEYWGALERQDKLSKEIGEKEAEIKDAKKEAITRAKERGLTISPDGDLVEGIKPVKIKVSTGMFQREELELSEDQILKFAYLNTKAQEGLGQLSFITRNKEQREKAKQVEEELRVELGENFDEIKRVAINLPEVKRVARQIGNNDYKQLSKIEGEVYMERGVIQQPVSIPIVRGKENAEDFKSRVVNILAPYAKDKDSDAAKIIRVLSDDINKPMRITADPNKEQGNRYVLQVSDGGTTYSMGIDRNSYTSLSGGTPPQEMSKPMLISKLDRDKTTNRTGKRDPSSAWFSMRDFSAIKNTDYTITGDFVQDEDNPDVVWLRMYLFNKDGSFNQQLTFPDPSVTRDRLKKYNQDGSYNTELERYPSAITDQIIQMLKNK